MSGPTGGRKAILAAFAANLGIAIAKLVGYVFTHSSSMLAEAVHSLADTGNQLLLLLGARRAARPATAEHAFGFGRERYFWAFVVALVLFIGGATFAIYEGIEKILHPHELPRRGGRSASSAWPWSSSRGRCGPPGARPAMRTWERVGMIRFVRETRAPELPVVLLEDTGALIGLVLALAGVTPTLATDQPVFDGIATLCIGILLAAIAVTLAIEMKSLLIGESALPVEERRIREALTDAPEVRSVIHLRTQHVGPEDVLVAAKLEFDATSTWPSWRGPWTPPRRGCGPRCPAARLMFLEPDLRRPGRSTMPGGERPEPRAGALLVATPVIGDPNFDRTVVSAAGTRPRASLGMVLNRPAELSVAEALPPWAELASPPGRRPHRRAGGGERGAWRWPDRATTTTRSGLGRARRRARGPRPVTSTPAELEGAVQALRLFAGYAGWGPGQLAGELAVGAWWVFDALIRDAFSPRADRAVVGGRPPPREASSACSATHRSTRP